MLRVLLTCIQIYIFCKELVTNTEEDLWERVRGPRGPMGTSTGTYGNEYGDLWERVRGPMGTSTGTYGNEYGDLWERVRGPMGTSTGTYGNEYGDNSGLVETSLCGNAQMQCVCTSKKVVCAFEGMCYK